MSNNEGKDEVNISNESTTDETDFIKKSTYDATIKVEQELNHIVETNQEVSSSSSQMAQESDQTSVKKTITLNAALHNHNNMTTLTPPSTPELNCTVQDGLSKFKETEEREDDEFAIQHSPKILNAMCAVTRGIVKILHLFWDLTKTCASNMKQCIPAGIGFALFVLLTCLLEHVLIPLGHNDLPHFPARLQYIARICVLGLFPVMVSWFVGQSPLLIRLVQSSMRDMFLVVLSFCALATFHPVDQMHWMFVYMTITTLFRMIQWFATCYCWKGLQKAMDGPMQVSLVTLVLYTFLSVVGQELSYMDRPNITKPMAQMVDAGTDVPQWRYPNMCNIVERMFCGATKPTSI